MCNNAINSIGCFGLDFFSRAVDLEDLMFEDLVSFMGETDAALSAKMKEIRTLNELKRELTRKMELLNEAIARSGATADDDTVEVYGTLEDPEERPGLRQCQGGSECSEVDPADEPTGYKRIDVMNHIEGIRHQIEELNSSSKVMLLDLQRLMNKRNESVQLVSNITAKSHQTALSIIANLK